MPRYKDINWELPDILYPETGILPGIVNIAVLMDIRDELKELNKVFSCQNALDIPKILRMIARNTTKPKKKIRR